MMAAARKSSRWGDRDATMILIAYRHGLRASDMCDGASAARHPYIPSKGTSSGPSVGCGASRSLARTYSSPSE
jgi:hypothetical protein